MADCGICLDVLRNPVSVPCGHIHCERCLRGHIHSGVDALRSACPTCRKPFHIASPDFTFVPQKYHEFILPSVRRVYMDIPSIVAITGEMDALTQRVEALAKENEHLRQRSAHYRDKLEGLESEKLIIIEQEAEARQEALDLRKKYDSLKKRYWEIRSRDDGTPYESLSRRSSQSFDTPHNLKIFPKVEEDPVSLQDLDLDLPRPKRALPKSRMLRRKNEATSQSVKRQRTHRHSDVGTSSQLHPVVFKGEDDEDE